MKFGRTWEREIVRAWRNHYIQYNDLKKDIEALEGSGYVDASAFYLKVTQQVDGVMRFYELRRRELEQAVEEARQCKERLTSRGLPLGETRAEEVALLMRFHGLGEQLTLVFHFLELNATALRKILKKFNKRVSTLAQPLLEQVRRDQGSALAENLRCMNDLSLLQPTIDALQSGIGELQSRLDPRRVARTGRRLSRGEEKRFRELQREGQAIVMDMTAMREQMRDSSNFLSFLSSQSIIPFRRGIVRKHSQIYALKAASARALMEAELARKEEEDRADVGMPLQFGGLPPTPRTPLSNSGWHLDEDEEEAEWVSEYINLASTFFYLANYNVCLPTSGAYAAHLGLQKSASGMIVAMTPIAALVSAVVYSYWSNFSFRKPLLCSGLFLVTGNVMYALAWDTGATWLILGGRFVTGLGGCRAVNRRYIADNIPVQERTRASAAFVAAGAMGMASGPLLASLFAGMDVVVLGVTVNEMTAPAWFMAIVWVLYGFLVLFRFREPQPQPGVLVFPEKSAGGGPGRSPSALGAAASPLSRGDSEDDADESSFTDSRGGGYDDFDDDDFDDDDDESLFGALDDSIDVVLHGNGPSNGAPESGGAGETGHTRYGTLRSAAKEAAANGSGNYIALEKARSARARRARRRALLTILSLWVIFWVKLVQEALLTGIPLVVPTAYGWGTRTIGVYMTSLGLFVVPCNMVLVAITKWLALRDQAWIEMLFVPLVVFSVMLVPLHGSPVAVLRYLAGDFGVFATAQVLEGVIMSYFSKIISAKLAAGTCNSGLLATEAGTLGRAFGNGVISMLGAGTAMELERNLYLFVATTSLGTLAIASLLFRPSGLPCSLVPGLSCGC